MRFRRLGLGFSIFSASFVLVKLTNFDNVVPCIVAFIGGIVLVTGWYSR